MLGLGTGLPALMAVMISNFLILLSLGPLFPFAEYVSPKTSASSLLRDKQMALATLSDLTNPLATFVTCGAETPLASAISASFTSKRASSFLIASNVIFLSVMINLALCLICFGKYRYHQFKKKVSGNLIYRQAVTKLILFNLKGVDGHYGYR